MLHKQRNAYEQKNIRHKVKKQKNDQDMNRRKHYGKRIAFLFLFLLLFLVIGGILPFLPKKSVSKEYQQQYQRETYKRDGISVDHAAIVETSTQALEVRLQMIEAAKHEIRLATFSMKPDVACQTVCAALYAAAERGVTVRILVDGGSGWWDMKNHPMFYALGTHPNVRFKYYNCVRPYAPWTLNARLHDKFLVVDETHLLLGGRNTSDYFLGENNKTALSYDREVYVYNTANTAKESVIAQVNEYFDTLWNLKVSRDAYEKAPRKKQIQVEQEKKAYDKLRKDRLHETNESKQLKEGAVIDTIAVHHISLISNPIHNRRKEPRVWYTLVQLMLDANDQVIIQTPYVIANDAMYEAFFQIGQDLRRYDVLLNSIAGGDNIPASSDYKLSRTDLLDTQISIYEFQGIHSSHNKSVVIDDRLAVIGSYNFDMRSTYINTETMLIIDGEEFAKELQKNIEVMQEESILVMEDGTYDGNSKVQPRTLSKRKRRLLSIFPYVLRPIRFLL